jgi:heat shock protein HtpX
MWEQIRINKRNSILLLAAMGFVLLALGTVFGSAWGGSQGAGGGLVIAAAVWLVMTLISFMAGDQILLASSGAVEVTSEVHPMLFNIVEEMKIAGQLPVMPKIYIIPDPSPNAFATGRNPEHASVAVTEGLLAKLNRDELQGVIAHEVSHIVHRDILFVTLASVILGSVALLSNIFLRSSSFGSGRRYSSGRGNNNAQGLMVLLAILLAILAPLLVQILYFALSRKREYMADAGAVRLTRYPEGLANALEKISSSALPVAAANKATAPMYIASPFRGTQLSLFSTHPPIEERIAVLRKMAYGSAYQNYDTAYRDVTGRAGVIPASALQETESVPNRPAAQAEPAAQTAPDAAAKAQQHIRIGDFIRQTQGFTFIDCPCGVKLKLPPNLKTDKVMCPRCKKIHPVNTHE